VLAFGFLAALVAGCGGGSVSAPGASPGATATPLTTTQVAVVPATAGTLGVGSAGGYTAAFAISAGAPAGITLSSTATTTAPAGAPAILSTARKAQAATTAIAPFLVVTATFSANVPAGIIGSDLISTAGAFAATLEYFVQISDLTRGSSGTPLTVGPVVPNVSGSLVFSNGTPAPALTAGHAYLLQFYTIPIPTPSPSPSASATATASATPTATASASAGPTASPTPSASPPASVSPTAAPSPLSTYAFSGPTVSGAAVSPPTQPAAITVPASGTYGTYGVSANIAFGSASTTAPFALTVAIGSQTQNDISPPASYPFYTGTAATPLFYIQVTSSAAVTFPKTPAITLTANSFVSSNTCSLFIYVNQGAGFAWSLVPGASGTISGNTVVIPSVALPNGLTENFAPNGSTPAFIGC
jgi:hypothetical protein